MSLSDQWFFIFCLSLIMLAIYDVHDRRGDVIFWALMVVATGICAVVTA